MAKSLVIIGDGRGDVHIAATPDSAGLLDRLQRRYPRTLQILHEEPDAGVLAVKVHERLAAHRLRGDWFDLPDATERVLQLVAEVDDRHHNHDGSPSYSAYASGCRHPECADARSAYARAYNRRPKVKAAVRDPEPPEHPAPPAEAGTDLRVLPAPAPVPPAPPKSGPSDEDVILSYLRRFAQPNRQIPIGSDSIEFVASGTGLSPDRVAVAVRKMFRSGALEQRGDHLFLGRAK